MTGKEIRRWAASAEELSKRWWVLLGASLLSMVPQRLGKWMFENMDAINGIGMDVWMAFPRWLSALLELSVAYMALTQVKGQLPRLKDWNVAFRREWFWKAAVLTGGMVVVNRVLLQKETPFFIMLSVAVDPLLFLLKYLLFLKPEKKLTELIRENVFLAFANYLPILGFEIMVILPFFVVGILLVVGIRVMTRVLVSAHMVTVMIFLAGVFLITIVAIIMTAWFLCWGALANARFAMELVFPGWSREEPSVSEEEKWSEMRTFTANLLGIPSPLLPVRREMRLFGQGWYYYDGQTARRKDERTDGI